MEDEAGPIWGRLQAHVAVGAVSLLLGYTQITPRLWEFDIKLQV